MPRLLAFIAAFLWLVIMAATGWSNVTKTLLPVVHDPYGSFLDVRVRQAELRTPYAMGLSALAPPAADCSPVNRPRPPKGRMVLPSYYLSGGHGPKNPPYAAAERPYVAMERRVSEAATRYVAYGDTNDAACLLAVLDDWARAGALLNYSSRESPQAWIQVGWSAAAAALALSVVDGISQLDQVQLQRVKAWLDQVARKQIKEAVNPSFCCNNLAYWRGLMAASVGVVAKDDELFQYGIDRYRAAIEEIATDGSFPREMQRHERALHYQNFAIEALVGIAELAAQQGIDLYAITSSSGRTLHDSVLFLLGALVTPALIKSYADEPQYKKSFVPGSGDLSWMEAYFRRFGMKDFERYLVKPIFNVRLGGNATIYCRTVTRWQ